MLGKKDIDHLAGLARIELKKEKEEKILKDLEKILNYFDELKTVNTEGVDPMTGGTFLADKFRDPDAQSSLPSEGAIKQFPKGKNGFLEIPPVFE